MLRNALMTMLHFTRYLTISAVLQVYALKSSSHYSTCTLKYTSSSEGENNENSTFSSYEDTETMVPLLMMLVHKWSGRLELVLRLIS